MYKQGSTNSIVGLVGQGTVEHTQLLKTMCKETDGYPHPGRAIFSLHTVFSLIYEFTSTKPTGCAEVRKIPFKNCS